MDEAALQDRIWRGLGNAARAIGVACDAYRPKDTTNPVASANRFLRIDVAFNAQDMRFARAGLPANPFWYGVCDAAYLLPGDYLVEGVSGRIWFVAALQSLLPPLCVLTNTRLTLTRPGPAPTPGLGAYGGAAASTTLLAGWPASLLHDGSTAAHALPADTRPEGAVALLPTLPAGTLARGDTLRDDAGRLYTVSGSEYSGTGWRLNLRRAAS